MSLKEMLVKRIGALIEIKSLITLGLVYAGIWGFVSKIVPVELFASWVGMIMIYFFQKDKKKEE